MILWLIFDWGQSTQLSQLSAAVISSCWYKGCRVSEQCLTVFEICFNVEPILGVCVWCSFSEYGKQVTRNGKSPSQLLNISLQMCYSHRDEQDRCTMESGVLPYHRFQVSMDWREHGYCWQPKGGKWDWSSLFHTLCTVLSSQLVIR